MDLCSWENLRSKVDYVVNFLLPHWRLSNLNKVGYYKKSFNMEPNVEV
jgi:hypothetical protein